MLTENHKHLCLNNNTKEYSRAKSNQSQQKKISKKSWLVTLLLLLFSNCLHRFYVGKIGTDIIRLLTGGCFLVGLFADLYKLLTNNFTDKNGAYIIRQ
ncbi:MAG: TM2 domain-containing protein [Clostridia bacterium]|nr:TM2 domain-containing protein [Clostridia bacterium]